MSILIAGGCGFIGANLAKVFTARGYDVIILDHNTSSFADEGILKNSKVKIIDADIDDHMKFQDVLQDYNITVFINNVSRHNVSCFEHHDLTGLLTRLNALKQHAVKLNSKRLQIIDFFSTKILHHNNDYSIINYYDNLYIEPISMDASIEASRYHIMKALFTEYNIDVKMIICNNIYGPMQGLDRILPRNIIRAIREKPILIAGQGKEIVNLLHIDDLCRAIDLILDKGNAGSTYHFCGEDSLTILNLVHMICEKLELLKPRANKQPYKNLIKFTSGAININPCILPSSNVANKSLGFKVQHIMDRSLSDIIQSYINIKAE